MAREKLICNCNGTMPLDGKGLARALKHDRELRVSSELCRRHVATFEAAVKSGDDLLVACTQEAPLFTELHEELAGGGTIRFVNIRENAGWSAGAGNATPKIAALLALAELPEPEPVPVVSYRSGGSVLVIGPGAVALDWAERLAVDLEVTVLITAGGDPFELPSVRRYPVHSGVPRAVTGHLGAFRVEWEQANPVDLEACTRCNACIRVCPEGAIDHSYQIDLARCRAHRRCVAACGEIRAIDFDRRERSRSERFDLVFDLSREPLVRLPQPPQGYFAPGPDPLAQALAARALAQRVGEFEKPRYFEYRERICAHARSGIIGCAKCIEVCSTGAITSEAAQNRVRVEPHLCMGCGGCATACPSGAITHAYPRMADLGARMKTALRVYRETGGEGGHLLLHAGDEARELIARLARRGKGLPPQVIPLEVFHVATVGLELMLGAIAFGAARLSVLANGAEPEAYLDAVRRQMGYAGEILAGLGLAEDGRYELIVAREPAALEQALWSASSPATLTPAAFFLSNEKRASLDFLFDYLVKMSAPPAGALPLSAGAPYGGVVVDRGKCTMCLACVGACPEGALLDARDQPQLRFIERNCVQCGLCEKTCPEDAIRLVPRLLLSADALQPVVLNEDRIFACVRCGKPFANERIIESMLGRLARHAMFSDPAALTRLKMCQDCRVIDLFEHGGGSIFDEFRRE